MTKQRSYNVFDVHNYSLIMVFTYIYLYSIKSGMQLHHIYMENQDTPKKGNGLNLIRIRRAMTELSWQIPEENFKRV